MTGRKGAKVEKLGPPRNVGCDLRAVASFGARSKRRERKVASQGNRVQLDTVEDETRNTKAKLENKKDN